MKNPEEDWGSLLLENTVGKLTMALDRICAIELTEYHRKIQEYVGNVDRWPIAKWFMAELISVFINNLANYAQTHESIARDEQFVLSSWTCSKVEQFSRWWSW